MEGGYAASAVYFPIRSPSLDKSLGQRGVFTQKKRLADNGATFNPFCPVVHQLYHRDETSKGSTTKKSRAVLTPALAHLVVPTSKKIDKKKLR